MSLLSEKLLQKESPAIPHLTCRVVHSFAQLEAIRQEWDALVLATGSDLYMSYDWCRCWWEAYGAGRQLGIFLFYRGPALCAIIPCFMERLWLGPLWLKLAKLLGSDSTIAMTNPPVQSGDAQEIYAILCHSLLHEFHCDSVLLAPIAGDYPCINSLRAALSSSPEHFHLMREKVLSPYGVLHLPETMDDYFKMLSQKQRSNYKRPNNLLLRTYNTQLECVTDPSELEAEFTSFVKMHTAQWQREGKLGHFGDWPASEKFNRALMRAYAATDSLRLIRLSTDAQPIAYQYCLQFGDTWYWRLPARVCGSEWERFSIGRLGLVKMIELAISQGIRHIELGAGHYGYKLDLGGEESSLLSLLVVKNRWTSRVRARLFARLSHLLHLAYYRIWYLKVAPRLPWLRRPLAKIWIRTRM